MRPLILFAFIASPAFADALDRAAGIYGSVLDPAQSCAVNPHELSFIPAPPHAVFHWAKPRLNHNGQSTTEDTYDLRDATDTSLTLQREGDAALAETGRRPLWILRLTQNPDGYCWGRADWPSVRCVEPSLRCDTTSPTS